MAFYLITKHMFQPVLREYMCAFVHCPNDTMVMLVDLRTAQGVGAVGGTIRREVVGSGRHCAKVTGPQPLKTRLKAFWK